MSNKKAFDEGIKTGIKLSEEIIKGNTEAINYLKEEVSKLSPEFSAIKEVYSSLREDVESIQVKELFGIVKTFDYKNNLEYEEKITILKLFFYHENTYGANNFQKQYLRRLTNFLEINPADIICNKYDELGIQKIDSKTATKALYLLLKEYLFLENNSHEYSNDYSRILNLFGKDVISTDAESLINIKVKTFGIDILYEQFGDEIDEFEKKLTRTPSYIDRKNSKYIEISLDCATVFFADTKKNNFNDYLDSNTYLVYISNEKLIILNKITMVKEIIEEAFQNFQEPEKYFHDKKICIAEDMIFYVENNTNLKFYDISTKESGIITQFPKETWVDTLENNQEKVYEIKNLYVINNKIIFGGSCLSVLDLIDFSVVQIQNIAEEELSSSTKFVNIKNCIYYCQDTLINTGKGSKAGFQLERYNLENKITTIASSTFSLSKPLEKVFTIMGIYHYDNVISVVLSWRFMNFYSTSDDGCDGFYFDFSSVEKSKPKETYFWDFSAHYYDIKHYRNFWIYNNGSKNYSLTRHDFVTDKKKVFQKNYGYTDKGDFLMKLSFGKEDFMHPRKYQVLNKWICTYDKFQNPDVKEINML